MNTVDAVRILRRNGVELHLDAEAGRLRYRVATGTVTEQLRCLLQKYLPEIVHDFTERAAIMEHDARLPRRVAERSAALEVGIRQRSETANHDRPSWAYDPDLDGDEPSSALTTPGAVALSGGDVPAGGRALTLEQRR